MKITYLRTQNLVNPIGIQSLHPVFCWRCESQERGKSQSAYRIMAAGSEKNLREGIYDVWDSGKVISSRNYGISYDGSTLASGERVFWVVEVWDEKDEKSARSDIAYFEMGLLGKHDWRARWITAEGDSAPVLGRVISLESGKNLRSARLYISGLGLYEAYINGKKIGDNIYFQPGESDVRDTVYYNTYDIREYLTAEGENTASFMLGNGQYANYRIHRQPGRYYKTDDWRNEEQVKGQFGQVKGIAQIHLVYEDGTVQTIGTDETWFHMDSPVTENSWYGGESYDARREKDMSECLGNPEAGFVKKWARLVEESEIPAGRLTGVEFEPIVVSEIISPDKIRVEKKKEAEGMITYLVDVGRNGAGFLEIAVDTDTPGQEIRIYPAEVDIFDGFEGHINQASCTQSASSEGDLIYDSYITKGAGREVYHPRFCYHGYRYAEVTVPSEIKITNENFRGYILRTSNAKQGFFTSSDEILNGINALTEKSIESNMYSTFTDCPQIEKLGWLETPSLMFYSMSQTYDISSWIPKLVRDMVDAQYENGRIAAIAPEYFEIGPLREDLNWNGSIILTAWQYYETYGNMQIFSGENYDAMTRYMEYLEREVAEQHLIRRGQMGEWGEMTSYGTTPMVLVETTAYYRLAVCMSRIAGVLERQEDREKYSQLAAMIKQAFHADTECYNEEFLYGNGTQSGYGCVLFSGIVLGANRQETLERLVAVIRENDYHLTSGEVGLKQVFSALAENGRSDIIYRMVTNDTMPSYKYFLDKGLTTLPEYWNFEDLWGTVMRSRNHAMMGHVKEWFTRYLVGISPEGMGYDRILIKPAVLTQVSYARGIVDSVHGKIEAAWKYDGTGRFEMEVTLPVGVKARVFLPVLGSNQKISVEGATVAVRAQGEYYELVDKLGSGSYRIVETL